MTRNFKNYWFVPLTKIQYLENQNDLECNRLEESCEIDNLNYFKITTHNTKGNPDHTLGDKIRLKENY